MHFQAISLLLELILMTPKAFMQDIYADLNKFVGTLKY